MNDSNTRTINYLQEEVTHLREQNIQLLKRLGVISVVRQEINTGDMAPLAGYTPIRKRVADRERASREEYEKIQEAERKASEKELVDG